MGSWTMACVACGLHWSRVGNLSEYERQSVESRPCPGCGGYTLVCREPRPADYRRPTPHATSRLRPVA